MFQKVDESKGYNLNHPCLIINEAFITEQFIRQANSINIWSIIVKLSALAHFNGINKCNVIKVFYADSEYFAHAQYVHYVKFLHGIIIKDITRL